MKVAGHTINEAMCDYIERHASDDTVKLLLKRDSNVSFDKAFAVTQIECRQKSKSKIPEVLEHRHFLFPKPINAEQCTHEQVAKFHASLFSPSDSVLDMTMGLGIDSYYIAQRVHALVAIECDEEVAEIGQYNFSLLNPKVEVLHGDSTEWLKASTRHFDTIFIDPARRSDAGRRLYGLADCRPNVLSLLPLAQQRAQRLIIKASPMLDLTQSVKALGHSVSDVYAISVKNDCKELLFCLDFCMPPEHVALHAINFDSTLQAFDISHPATSRPPAPLTQPAFIYEPNASIMKIGCFDALAAATGATQLAQNSHLYVSDTLLEGFPGRRFKIKQMIPFKDKEIKTWSKQFKQLNIATRNFRLSPEALKKRLGVQDGGSDYLFATTLADSTPVLFLCAKV